MRARWCWKGWQERQAKSPRLQKRECRARVWAQDRRVTSGEAPSHTARQRSRRTAGGHCSQSCRPGAAAKGVGQRLGRAAGCPQDAPASLGSRAAPPWALLGRIPWCPATGGIWVGSCGEQSRAEVSPLPAPSPMKAAGGLSPALVAGGPFLPPAWRGRPPPPSLPGGSGGLCQALSQPETGCRAPLLRPPASAPSSLSSHILLCVCLQPPPWLGGGGSMALSPRLDPGFP